MLNIVLFGPPGAGKGTQSQKLIDKYGLVHLSTGDLLRSEIARGTALGMEAKQLMDKGDLVGDDIVIGMIESKLDANPNANGFIFDGFPRTQAQAIALDDLLQKKGTAISAMIALEVDNEELVKRLLLRGKESGRPDDQNEEIIRNRVNEYNNKTLPLKKYYSEQTKFHSINGIGSIESIFNDIVNRIVFIQAEIELTMLENDIEHLDMTINDFEVATEISDELKKDIDEVRKVEEKVKVVSKSKTSKPAPKKAVVKKTASKPAAKKATKAKPIAKKTIKKAKAEHKKVNKKPTKKVIAKKAVKKVVVKKQIKKAVAKKAAPKKITKKITPKKVAKKVVAKKIALKKVTAKKLVIKKANVKKIAAKKIVSKAKKVAVKKTVNKKKK
jgi:adenylate kinase